MRAHSNHVTQPNDMSHAALGGTESIGRVCSNRQSSVAICTCESKQVTDGDNNDVMQTPPLRRQVKHEQLIVGQERSLLTLHSTTPRPYRQTYLHDRCGLTEDRVANRTYKCRDNSHQQR